MILRIQYNPDQVIEMQDGVLCIRLEDVQEMTQVMALQTEKEQGDSDFEPHCVREISVTPEGAIEISKNEVKTAVQQELEGNYKRLMERILEAYHEDQEPVHPIEFGMSLGYTKESATTLYQRFRNLEHSGLLESVRIKGRGIKYRPRQGVFYFDLDNTLLSIELAYIYRHLVELHEQTQRPVELLGFIEFLKESKLSYEDYPRLYSRLRARDGQPFESNVEKILKKLFNKGLLQSLEEQTYIPVSDNFIR